ncbi:MAG: VWA domain-containing protein [Bryobacteraceae bacterium]
MVDESEKIVQFSRFVRDHGFTAGITETVGSVEAARIVGVGDQAILKMALRAELCSSKDEWDRFDDLFDAFWKIGPVRVLTDNVPKRPQQPKNKNAFLVMSSAGTGSFERLGDDRKTASGAARQERLRRVDFSQVSHGDQAELERMAERFFKQASFRLSRTLKVDQSGDRVDLRRSIRHCIATGGDPFKLRFKARQPKRPTLVILLDVSGSMSLYSFFLLRFAHALQKHFRKAATLIFSTSLLDITAALRSQRLSDAMVALSRKDAGWSGGTRIGESLREFNLHYGKRLLSRDTLLMILSDGWDTGEPAALASELRAIQRRVNKIIWLNPLLGLPDYQPVTRGMAAALPYIDVFAPAHSLESLLRLEKTLTRLRR